MMDYQITMWPELFITSCMLSDPPSHKAGYTQLPSIIKWTWYICNWARASSEGTSKFHEEVAQMPLLSASFTMLSVPKHTLQLYGVCLMLVD